jgi:hypothetical protein
MGHTGLRIARHLLALRTVFNRRLVELWKRFGAWRKRLASGLQMPLVAFSMFSAKLSRPQGIQPSHSSHPSHPLRKVGLEHRNLLQSPLIPSILAISHYFLGLLPLPLPQAISIIILFITGVPVLRVLHMVAVMGGPAHLHPFGVFLRHLIAGKRFRHG